jgi:hypothetical protein
LRVLRKAALSSELPFTGADIVVVAYEKEKAEAPPPRG